MSPTKRKSAVIKTEVERYVREFQRRGIAAEWYLTCEAVPNLSSDETVLSLKWGEDYRWAHLRINLASEWVQKGGKSLRRGVLHELCHLLIAPAADCVDVTFLEDSPFSIEFSRRVETSADNIANVLWRILEHAN